MILWLIKKKGNKGYNEDNNAPSKINKLQAISNIMCSHRANKKIHLKQILFILFFSQPNSFSSKLK